jgi:predicted AlkP superfamily pyrophosphatase or phosphodiesterase
LKEDRPVFLVYIFDGLRPELVREDLMPNLWALRQRGTWFERSHCVFPPVTRVNAASLATGSYPSRHGISSNTLYLPNRSGETPFGTTGDVAILSGLPRSKRDTLLNVPTTAEVLAEAGMRTVAVGTGSPGSAYLLHPEAARVGGAVFHYDYSQPAGLLPEVEGALGKHEGTSREYAVDNLAARIGYATRALVEHIAPSVGPELVYFWCTVPDALHHRFGLGSAEATAGLRIVDESFRQLVEGLGQLSGSPLNVIVTADHGYATVEGHIDVAAELAAAGFGPDAGDCAAAVTVDGGAAHIFLNQRSRTTYERLVAYLGEQSWVSAIFSREPVAGALPVEAALVDCERAADVIACLAWRHGDNGRGFDGFSLGGGGIAVGGGDHGGASPFEMRNTLIASGPSFRPGASDLPAGIVDVAPTVCRVLGLTAPQEWTGRVLVEALPDGGELPTVISRETRSERLPMGTATTLSVTAAGATHYIDQAGKSR